MRSKYMAATGCLVAALSLGVAACGDEEPSGTSSNDGGGETAEGKNITIFSSLPLQGASRVQTEAMVNGIKLALEQKGGKAGPHTIKYESLDDSTAQAGSWTPEAESANALKAAQDESTGVYIGAFFHYVADYDLDGLIDLGSTTEIHALDNRRPATPIADVEQFYHRSTKRGEEYSIEFQKMYDEGIGIALKYFGE